MALIQRDHWSYGDAWDYQLKRAELRQAGACLDSLILTEHAPVYTLGRSAKESELLTPNPQTAAIPRVVSDRGGRITYHGPGQTMGYVIWDLRPQTRAVRAHVVRLEETILQVLRELNVAARRDDHGPGIWVGAAKIAAIGVRVSHGVTLHGFSLNRDPDLSHYAGIIPCGAVGGQVTSLAQLGIEITRPALEQRLIHAFEVQFTAQCKPIEELLP
uniref:Octanoyltransferase n=1 Tax=Magnetococcus massalia (strain MO-1) TaxID=451514 RepID=A0A1S7LQV6_MAGMO|nr:Octanoyltransferase [Candidatus Magnetococcus massalia]